MAESALSLSVRRNHLRTFELLTNASLLQLRASVSARQALVATGILLALIAGVWALPRRAAALTPSAAKSVQVQPPSIGEQLRPGLETPNAAASPSTYAVVEGDTIDAIAEDFGVDSESIVVASGLGETALLEAGQALLIPSPPISARSVEPDLTPREVATQYEVEVGVLLSLNGMSEEALDEPLGRRAVVLPVGVVTAPGPGLRPVESAREAAGGTALYTIIPGDTLLGISLKLGVPVDALAAANRLANPDRISAGDELHVPVWAQPAQTDATVADPLRVAAVEATAVESSAAPTPQSEPLRAPVTYEVAPGDTVSTVAARFGVDAETIVTANSLSNPDRIKVGDELTILPVSGVVHTVRAGQTLSGIAALYKVDLGPIIDFNYLEDADIIAVGKELIIPGARPLPPPATARPVEYDVAPGDTLSTIGARFGVSPGAIASANGIRNPDLLTVGNRLVIPNARGQAGQQVVTRNLPVPAGASAAGVPAPANLGGGSSIMSIAVRYQGARYVWGGTSPAGFDCSGFVYYVQAQSGHPVARGLWGQYNAGPHPSKSELLPGDIVFFQNTYMAGLSHNGIYIGGGQFISAVDERSGVRISSLWEPYWANRWFGASRVW